MLELRAPDLPGLHDAEPGRHALPGVRAPDDARSSGCRPPAAPSPARHVRPDRDLRDRLPGVGPVRRDGRCSGTLFRDGALFGPAVENGDYYRLVSAGFLHAGLLHIGFNMYLLCLLGRSSSPSIGSPRFAALYFASLLAGSFGALLFEPTALTVGASGAVFGLMGAMAAMIFARGDQPVPDGDRRR